MFRTWNMRFLDLWQQSFYPVCQNCILLVYMNSLWDVGIRSDITWRETLFEPWRKNFDLFLKTAFYVSKGTFWVKKKFLWKFWFFFKLFQTLNEPLLCFARKFSAGISKLKRAVFVSYDQSKKTNFWKFSLFYQILQNFERTFTVLGEKVLGRDIEIENCTLCLQSIMLGIKIIFWRFCKFSFYSDLEHNMFGFVATEVSPGLSKMHSKCLLEFSLRCWF